MRARATILAFILLLGGVIAATPRQADAATTPLWVNALNYGSVGGGFYWDPSADQVWTAERGWHSYAPASPSPTSTIWVNELDYGSAGGGFYLDPLTNQVWTSERSWHTWSPGSASAPPPSPTPAAGCTLSASVSDGHPAHSSQVTVTGTLKCTGGATGAGATMHTVWHYATVDSTCDGTANAAGVASCTRDIGNATAGRAVTIDVTMSKAGQTYSAQTSFTPQ